MWNDYVPFYCALNASIAFEKHKNTEGWRKLPFSIFATNKVYSFKERYALRSAYALKK